LIVRGVNPSLARSALRRVKKLLSTEACADGTDATANAHKNSVRVERMISLENFLVDMDLPSWNQYLCVVY